MEWYYAKKGKREGPVSGAALKSMIASGEIASTDLVWREGMADWKPAAAINDFESAGVVEPAGIVASPGGSQIPQGGVPQPVAGSAYARASAPALNGMAIASMVLGIIGVFGAAILTSVPAIIFGHIARRQIRNTEGREGGEGMALAGLILGYVVTVLSALVIVFIIVRVAQFENYGA